MTEEQTLRTLPDRPRRHCPECGARVAEGATTCLICGTELPPETEEGTSRQDTAAGPLTQADGEGRRLLPLGTAGQPVRPLRVVILALVAVVILGGSVVLGMNLSQGGGAAANLLPTFTPTLTNTPTITPTPTPTSTPTQTPTPTLTPTPIPPTEYVVQSGDTLLGIALEFNLTVDELVAYNGLESDVIVEGDVLQIPAPTPTPGPTPTPKPGEPTATVAAFILHTVRSGDTLSTIAEQYGVSVDEIRAANDIPADSETIQLNQVLTIPRSTPTPEPQVIVTGQETATPTPGVMRYPAPQMLYPPDDTVFTGADAVIALQWASVGILDDREYYRVELIIPTADGTTTIETYTKSTVWRVPSDMFPPETVDDRTCSWRVLVARQVTEGADPDRIISTAGRRRSFTWAIGQ